MEEEDKKKTAEVKKDEKGAKNGKETDSIVGNKGKKKFVGVKEGESEKMGSLKPGPDAAAVTEEEVSATAAAGEERRITEAKGKPVEYSLKDVFAERAEKEAEKERREAGEERTGDRQVTIKGRAAAAGLAAYDDNDDVKCVVLGTSIANTWNSINIE
ncbi:uncharacterized protein [Pseudochaenichthys georgianus]|uniref:uncharacterized protein isoform X2 n=1 Tax=Pseudochaenichthys georgianus TaxID=52239 RepID=UPI0039C20111